MGNDHKDIMGTISGLLGGGAKPTPDGKDIQCSHCDADHPQPGTNTCGCGATVFPYRTPTSESSPPPRKVTTEFVGAKLMGGIFRGSSFEGVDFSGSDCMGANFSRAKLKGARFKGANCMGTNFRGADLRDVCFDGADLMGADLAGADTSGASFSGANQMGVRR